MRLGFLYASIADTQGTIRAIDVRAGFLFIILFIPFSFLEKIGEVLGLPTKLTSLLDVWVSGILTVWSAALYVLFRCVIAIDSPSAHVVRATPRGAFYSADLFKPTLLDVWFWSTVTSSRDTAEERAILPSSDDDFEMELTFEKIKLCYIRTMKLKRFTTAAWLTLGWLILSFSLALYTRTAL